jgi:diacylglycerol kinase family enzyme
VRTTNTSVESKKKKPVAANANANAKKAEPAKKSAGLTTAEILKATEPLHADGIEIRGHAREQLRELLRIVKAVRNGDFSVRAPMGDDGVVSEIAAALRSMLVRRVQIVWSSLRPWSRLIVG